MDKYHTVLIDTGYRARLEMLRGLYRYGCPVVLLIAILPVGELERQFRKVMIAEDAEIMQVQIV